MWADVLQYVGAGAGESDYDEIRNNRSPLSSSRCGFGDAGLFDRFVLAGVPWGGAVAAEALIACGPGVGLVDDR